MRSTRNHWNADQDQTNKMSGRAGERFVLLADLSFVIIRETGASVDWEACCSCDVSFTHSGVVSFYVLHKADGSFVPFKAEVAALFISGRQ